MKHLISFSAMLSLILSSLLYSPTAYASHALGSEIVYECLGDNDYKFSLYFYRDCAGITTPSVVDIEITSSCAAPTTIALYPEGPPTEISPVCAAEIANTTCNGGSIPGAERQVYSALYTLPTTCNDWYFSYSICCRNEAITNTPTPNVYNLYIDASLDNSAGLCNTSPSFVASPLINVCAGNPSEYLQGAIDVDGDSLVYSLVAPLTDSTTEVPFQTGFTADYPISTTPANSFFMNKETGSLYFTPDNQQVGVVSLLIEEYRDGLFIGNSRRDIQISVNACSSNSPDIALPPTNISGGTLNGSTFDVCAGNTLSFDLSVSDIDAQDTIEVYTDFTGGTVTMTGTNPVVATYEWETSNNDFGLHFVTFTATDGACPLPGNTDITFQINVSGVEISAPSIDTMGCSGCPLSIPLDATASSGANTGTYAWTPTVGLDNPNIATPVATVTQPTTYTVTYDDGICTVQNEITLPIIAAPVCGTTLDSCINAGSTIGIGFDTILSGTYSTEELGGTPYLGYYTDGRTQILFRASELIDAGLTPGLITELSFEVAAKNSTAPYTGFTIKISCTEDSLLTGGISIYATEEVFSNDINTSLGWNVHTFDQPYKWNGISNLLVEICYDNEDYTEYDHVYCSATSYSSVKYARVDYESGCSMQLTNLSTNRPNVQLGTCQAIPPLLPKTTDAYTASYERVDSDGWTHYIQDAGTPNDLTDDLLLLSIQKGNSGIVVSPQQIQVGVRGTEAIDLSAAPYVNNSKPWYAMSRYWNVSPTVQPNAEGVNVRFYFTLADYLSVRFAANTAGTAIADPNDLVFYKFATGSGVDPDPTAGHLGGTAANFLELAANAYRFNNDYLAEFHVGSFSGGGGGGVGCTSSPCGPVATADILPNEGLYLSPNPVSKELMVRYGSSKAQTSSLIIYDLNGRKMVEKSIRLQTGENELLLPLNLPAGVYFLSVNGADGVVTKKFVKL